MDDEPTMFEAPPMEAPPIEAPPAEAPAMGSPPISVAEPDMDDEPTIMDNSPIASAAAAVAAGTGIPEEAVGHPYETPDMMMPQPAYADGATLANPLARLAAHIVDGLIAFSFYIPATLVMIVLGGPESAISSMAAMVTMLALLGLAIYQLVLLSRDGQTLGKKVMKVRIVRYDDEGNPGFGRAVGLRLFVNGLICITMIYPLVDILFIFGGEHRCLHDYIAGTKVVTTY
jgi:uncharacterized RDD family membrane protein YckC